MINHLSQVGKTQTTVAVSSTQEAALIRGQEKLAGLSDGQTVRGKVLSVSEDAGGARTAQVDLGGGAVVNARLSGNMALSEGQDISFSVKNGNEGGSVTLRPLYANTAADSSVMKALTQAGLPANADMTAMVREMMSEGMSVDRASLMSMTRGVNTFPGHATSIVQMTNLGIPLTGENIEQFENYKNYEHQVMKSIDSIMDELPDAFRAMSEGGNTKGALDLYGELLHLFSGEEGAESVAQPAAGQTTVITEEALLNGDVQKTGGQPAQTAETVPGQQTAEVPAGQQTAETAAGQTAVPAGEAAARTDMDSRNALLEALRGSVREENAQSGASVTGAGKDAVSVLENAMNALNEAGNTGEAQAAVRSPQFTALLRAVHVPEQVIQNLQQAGNQDAAQTELLRALSDAWQKTGHQDDKTDAAWSKLFSSRTMNGILKDAVANDWLLKPADVENKDNIRHLYDRLQNQTAKLAQVLSDTQASGTHLAESVRNLQHNLDFMNDLNHMFQFVQLPLKMNGQNTHGDLYVYSNKKNAMHEDGTVSAILHLDMEHLGPVDVYVKMRDNNVKTNFYLADDEMIDLIMAHIDTLNERLQKRGYSMEAKMHLQEEEITEDLPVREMLSGNLGSMSMLSQTSFDALA